MPLGVLQFLPRGGLRFPQRKMQPADLERIVSGRGNENRARPVEKLQAPKDRRCGPRFREFTARWNGNRSRVGAEVGACLVAENAAHLVQNCGPSRDRVCRRSLWRNSNPGDRNRCPDCAEIAAWLVAENAARRFGEIGAFEGIGIIAGRFREIAGRRGQKLEPADLEKLEPVRGKKSQPELRRNCSQSCRENWCPACATNYES